MIYFSKRFPKWKYPIGYLKLLKAHFNYFDHLKIDTKTPKKFGFLNMGGYQSDISKLRNKHKGNFRFLKICKNVFGRKFVLTGSRPDSCRSRELNRRLGRPRERQGGPNQDHLDPKIGQKHTRKMGFLLVFITTLHITL